MGMEECSSKVEQLETSKLIEIKVGTTTDLIEEDSVHIVDESKLPNVNKCKFISSTH